MSQGLTQLCALLLEDTYGMLYSHLFTTLMSHGRLSAREISQKSHLPVRQVLQALAILTQHTLVFHNTPPGGRTSYQANPFRALSILRVGRFAELMEYKFGHIEVKILAHLLIHGHDTVENIEGILTEVKNPGLQDGFTDTAVHGGSADDIQSSSPDTEHRILEHMLEEDYLIELRPAHFQTLSDTQRLAEDTVKVSGYFSTAKGKKAKEDFDHAVRAEVETRLFGGSASIDAVNGSKRPAPNALAMPVSKKQKAPNGTSKVAIGKSEPLLVSESAYLTNHNVLGFNHRKLLLLRRHQIMVDLAREQMGPQPGRILAALLRQSERLSPNATDLPQLPFHGSTSSKNRVVRIDMARLLQDANTIKGQDSSLVNGYVNGSMSEARENHIDSDELAEEVAALADGYCGFIYGTQNIHEWELDLNDAEEWLRHNEIMQMIKRRFGPTSFRIVQILISRGKVDEKALQEIGLVNAKDLRKCLAQLTMHGFVDLQEVPREPQRQPARTIYLWFYDAERVRKRVLENLYKSMCRLLQRLKVERTKVDLTLQKIERSDVKGKEHEILRNDEITVLKRWRRKEGWYLSELERLSSSVDVLGEY